MSKEEVKNMFVSTRVTTNFYRQIRDYMAKNNFENISEFIRYCVRKVLEGKGGSGQ
jgi:Arc/MetJ-type ribon-helix-helix transcriptional regulator